MTDDISLDDSYDDFPRIEEAFGEALDASLDPRGPEALFDLVRGLELAPGSTALDVGCGEGDDALRLTRDFGFHVHGVDPVQRHIELATAAGVESSLGSAEHLPIEDSSVDFVWCKEVLMYADLDRAFGEFHRVLRPNGVGFVYQVLTGPLMTDDEARKFWDGEVGHGAHSVRPENIETSIAGAGLALRERIDFTSEWGEYAQERRGAGGRRLVHAARLLRDPDRYIAEYGAASYRVMLGDCLWHVYRMIGKLTGVAFVFGHS